LRLLAAHRRDQLPSVNSGMRLSGQAVGAEVGSVASPESGAPGCNQAGIGLSLGAGPVSGVRRATKASEAELQSRGADQQTFARSRWRVSLASSYFELRGSCRQQLR